MYVKYAVGTSEQSRRESDIVVALCTKTLTILRNKIYV